MQFKKFSAGVHSYGTDNEPTGKQESNVSFEDQNLEIALKNGDEALIRTIFFLACCHTIVIDARKGTYNAASPDELALVNAAKQFGYEFSDRDQDDNIVITEIKTGAKHKYQLLNVCEFTSTRKR
jgi:magnesium-transporting ATPase (P-type)